LSISRPRLYCSILLAVVIGGPFASNTCAAQRAIPDDNLAYPVLITLGNGTTGSGFYLHTNNAIYLVTAKHVLFDLATHKLRNLALELLSYSKDPSDSTRNVASVDLSVLQNSGKIKAHPSEDVVVVEVGTIADSTSGTAASGSIAAVPGVTFRDKSTGGLLVVDVSITKPFNQVLVGNEVIVFGYPTSLGLQQLPQIDIRRPLLRKGIVAGTNPQKQSIILDCPSYFGNSGGPVVELDREGLQTHLNVIGVVTQYVPFADAGQSGTFMLLSNSGYSITTPMNFVLDLVK